MMLYEVRDRSGRLRANTATARAAAAVVVAAYDGGSVWLVNHGSPIYTHKESHQSVIAVEDRILEAYADYMVGASTKG